jgi:hypothetical protein
MSFTSRESHSAFPRPVSPGRDPAPGNAEPIFEYLENRAALLRAIHLEDLLRELPLLRIQFAGLVSPRFPHLGPQLKLLSEFFNDSANGVFAGVSPAVRREVALALRYVAKNTDVVGGKETGYADDSHIVRAVLRRHQDVFREYCALRKISWPKITGTA